MIKLAVELPSAYLARWTSRTDLDFALAHRVLEDDAYAEHFVRRTRSRELILDNSMHELGRPLPPRELLLAARRCRADYVIAPDLLGRPSDNLRWFHETRDVLGTEFPTAVVMCGRTPDERAYFLKSVADAAMICLPFRESRAAWYVEQEHLLERWERVHLLGVSSLEELAFFRDIELADPVEDRWSVDTGKPVKWGHVGLFLQDVQKHLRGAKLSSNDLLSLIDLSEAQIEMVERNIDFLRAFLVEASA